MAYGHALTGRRSREAEMGTDERAEGPVAEATAPPRKIIHIDMDAFYASVEQRDNRELRGKPVAVGGSRERGVVAAASYEARKFGVHSAMPSVTAKRKCPDLIFVSPRFDTYKAISLQIREVLAEYTPIIEPLSLDEAYLDVTENLKGIISATQIAEEIRARIRAETELTASAGVSYNKFLAKLASDHRKPDGLFVITPKVGPKFVATLGIYSRRSVAAPEGEVGAFELWVGPFELTHSGKGRRGTDKAIRYRLAPGDRMRSADFTCRYPCKSSGGTRSSNQVMWRSSICRPTRIIAVASQA